MLKENTEFYIKQLEYVRTAAKALVGDFVLYDIFQIIQNESPFPGLYNELYDDLSKLSKAISMSEEK